MSSIKEKAILSDISEKAYIDKNVIEKIKLNKYHSVSYLKNISKRKRVIYVLPNGKEVEFNG